MSPSRSDVSSCMHAWNARRATRDFLTSSAWRPDAANKHVADSDREPFARVRVFWRRVPERDTRRAVHSTAGKSWSCPCPPPPRSLLVGLCKPPPNNSWLNGLHESPFIFTSFGCCLIRKKKKKMTWFISVSPLLHVRLWMSHSRPSQRTCLAGGATLWVVGHCRSMLSIKKLFTVYSKRRPPQQVFGSTGVPYSSDALPNGN